MMKRIAFALALLAGGCGLSSGEDRKDPNNPFGESDTSPSLERNAVQAAILRDWRRSREPALATFSPGPAPAGIIRTPEGVMTCSADQSEIQTFTMRDPHDYNPNLPHEVAYYCPKHGAYWYDIQRGENALHQVYGPFRLQR